jgi:hypothetical protein
MANYSNQKDTSIEDSDLPGKMVGTLLGEKLTKVKAKDKGNKE